MVEASQHSSASSGSSEPTPIASSQGIGWWPLIVEEYHLPPNEVDMPGGWPGHSIALCLSPQPYRIHQIVGSRRYTGIYSRGDISLRPMNVPASYRTEGEDRYLNVQIPPKFLQKVAEQTVEVDTDRLELTTEFRTRDPQLEHILMMLQTELHRGGDWISRLYVESLANVLMIHLLRQYSTSGTQRESEYRGGLSDRKILQVSEYIHAHLDRTIKISDLAEVAGMSQFHFSRLFKQSMGIPPHQYLLQQRVEKAKQLLTGTKETVAEIALQCGFSSQSQLTQHFRGATGMTPSLYRKS